MIKLNRREFLKLALAAGSASLILPRLPRGLSDVKAQPSAGPEVMAGKWVLTGQDMLPEVDQGTESLRTQEQAEQPYYFSPILRSNFTFNAIGAQWQGRSPEDTSLKIDVRASADQTGWSSWTPLREMDALRGLDLQVTDLAFVSGRYLQIRTSSTLLDPSHPLPWEQLTITYINSVEGPTAREAAASTPGEFRISKLMPPAVISRFGWGANERYLLDTNSRIAWPPSYSPARNIIVHHTATDDGGQDPAAMVRAIYYFHAITNRWGDIGYNFLVDKYGNVYEGRTGGPNVVGAHTLGFNSGSVGIALIGNFQSNPVPSAALDSLSALVLLKSVQHGIPPNGTFPKDGKSYSNLMGHRDANNTTCPGEQLHALLPTLKQNVVQSLPPYGVAWVTYKLPTSIKEGTSISITVDIKNSGTGVLKAAGTGRAVVNYRWLQQNGAPYTAEGGMNGSLPLPKDLVPYEGTSVTTPIRVPKSLGQYILRWDAQPEGGETFSSQGVPALDLSLKVPSILTTGQGYKRFIPTVMKNYTMVRDSGGGAAP